jgi:hypothetical protein
MGPSFGTLLFDNGIPKHLLGVFLPVFHPDIF